MSRFMQVPKEKSQNTKKEKPREMTKPGSYSSEDLMGTKKIPTKGGYQ